MLSTINVDRVLKNIYGDDSTQSMASLSGGYSKKPLKRPIGYSSLVIGDATELASRYRFNLDRDVSFFDMSGGGKKKRRGGSDQMIYATPYYYIINNPEAEKWVNACGLSVPVQHPQSRAIIVIPPKAQMTAQIKEVQDALDKEGIKFGTTKANEFINTHRFEAQHYCLNVYGSSSPDNEGMDYAVPEGFPDSGSDKIIRRTARSSGVFYLQFSGAGDIKCGTDKNLSNATTLKFVAKCEKDVYVLTGEMPSPTEESVRPERNVVTMTGGDLKTTTLPIYFKRLIKYRNGDLDAAAYDFIGALGCSGTPTKTLLKHYSSNFLHSAFENIFSGDDEKVLNQIFEDSKINNVHREIQKEYKARPQKISMQKAKAAIAHQFIAAQSQARSGADANKLFIKGMEKLYSKNDSVASFKADVAMGVVRGKTGVKAFEDAVHFVDEMYDTSSANDTETVGFNGRKSTPLMDAVYNLTTSSPFIGVYSKETVPIPVDFSMRVANRASKSRASDDEFDDDDELYDGEIEGGDKPCPVCGDKSCPGCGKNKEDTADDEDFDAFV